LLLGRTDYLSLTHKIHAVDKLNFCYYIASMLIEFDPAKDALNRAKHGISLGDAALVNWDAAITWMDERVEYGEARMSGLGLIGSRLFHIAFVERKGIRRVISLRKANKREVKTYVDRTQTQSVYAN